MRVQAVLQEFDGVHLDVMALLVLFVELDERDLRHFRPLRVLQ